MHALRRRLTALAAAVGLMLSLGVATATTATAAESLPALQYPAVGLAGYADGPVPGASGSVTLPCNPWGGVDLVTYGSSGTLVRQLDRTQYADGVKNCIERPVTDKNGVLYGTTYGQTPSGSWARGQYLYAYTGNTLKWKYPLACGSQGARYAVGATGTIYATAWLSDGMHLIGIAPELEAGETQPKKVFDVKVPNDCGAELFPYRDGFMLRGQNSGIRFYSNTGALISQPSVNRFWDVKLNAQGHLFDYQFVTGSYTSVNVIKIDPAKNNPDDPNDKKRWTTSASTSGANVQNVRLYPLTTGGVVAVIREQKMASPGVPWTPTEYIENLVTLDAAGQKVISFILPKTAPQGTYGASYFAPTVNGKLAVVRDMRMNTGKPSPTTVPAVTTSVYDPVTGTSSNEELIAGDIAKSSGPYGYYVAFGTEDSAITSTPGALNLLVKCDGNCSGISQKLLAVSATSSAADYPRSTVVGTAPRPASSYIALGDSFSAGEGLTPFHAGTDFVGVNLCHRSSAAYPQLIAGTSAKIPSFGTGGFRACSGAVSQNIGDGAPWNEGIQLDWWPDTTTQLVTMSDGGNDILFGDFAKACVDPASSCVTGSTAYNNSLNKINNELEGRLKDAYRKVLKYAPNAKVFVVGYPQVIADKGPQDPIDGRCPYMYDLFDGSDHWKETRAARDIVTKLNQKISAAVTAVRAEPAPPGNTRLHYVPVDEATSQFVGHEVCGTSTSWFLNVDQAGNNPSYVFHPNAAGQQGYATMVSAYINAN